MHAPRLLPAMVAPSTSESAPQDSGPLVPSDPGAPGDAGAVAVATPAAPGAEGASGAASLLHADSARARTTTPPVRNSLLVICIPLLRDARDVGGACDDVR